ncbi:MAG: TetR/AcrR family transcriptional regulator [Betaproteobacteria bacterium]
MSPPEDNICACTRTRLIEAARDAFMNEGYRASMEAIAARAGVAKQTLYNHFSSKDELFSEAARLFSEAILVTLDSEDDDFMTTLRNFARTFRERALSEEGVAVFRSLIAESNRFPALAQAFLVKGHVPTATRLAAFLEAAMDDGILRRDDPKFAAEMLMGMLAGSDKIHRLCATPRSDMPEDERIEKMLDCFLRAYAPPSNLRK